MKRIEIYLVVLLWYLWSEYGMSLAQFLAEGGGLQ